MAKLTQDVCKHLRRCDSRSGKFIWSPLNLKTSKLAESACTFHSPWALQRKHS